MSIFKVKIKALTLIDAMVGLIISSIAVAFAASAYQVVHKQFYQYKRINKTIVEVTQFNTVITNDFFTGRFVKKNNNGIEIDMPMRYGQELSNALYENQITYQFLENYVIRKVNNNPDTFFLVCTNPLTSFMKQSQDQNSALVDEMSLCVKLFNEVDTLHFQKRYSADVLMQAQLDPESMGWGTTFDNK